MLKILLFTLEYPPFKGGVANYYYNLIKHWPKKKEIFILNNNDNQLINKKLPFLKWLPSFYYLLKKIKKNNIKYIIVGHILPLGIITWILSYFLNFKYSIFLHGMDFTYSQKKNRKKILTKKILTKANYIFCANSYVADLVRKEYNFKNKIKIINPGIDSNFSLEQKQSIKQKKQELIKKYNLKNKIILFSLGRLVKRKGFDQVIKALNLIESEQAIVRLQLNLNYHYFKQENLEKKNQFLEGETLESRLQEINSAPSQSPERNCDDKNLNYHYFIAGQGPDEEYLKNLLKNKNKINKPCFYQNNFNNKITFLNQISEIEKWSWLSLSDIFLMPSRNINGDVEGFGIVYLEANLMNTPVIASYSGGIQDAVINNFNGLLVDPENTKELANSITKLIKDKNLRQKLGNQGKQRVLNNFQWSKKIKEIYHYLISSSA